MPFWKRFKKSKPTVNPDNSNGDNDDKRREEVTEIADDHVGRYTIEVIYFESVTRHEKLLYNIKRYSKYVECFIDGDECIEYLKSITKEVFLVIDHEPSETFIEAIEPLKQIDSLFIYSPSSGALTAFRLKPHTYLYHQYDDVYSLICAIRGSNDELDSQKDVFNMYNQKEKTVYNLSKERSSFLYYHLFKFPLKNLPKTREGKRMMVRTMQKYYLRNFNELAFIERFDGMYRSSEAIQWFIEQKFFNEFINKTLRTQDLQSLYTFSFYILDLRDLITNSEYLLTTSEYSIAYDSLTKFPKQEGVARVLIEYFVDFDNAKNIVIGDIGRYSSSPERTQFLIDIGGIFQIDSCDNIEEDLWHIKLRTTNEGTSFIDEFMEYQKKRMDQSNIKLFIGNLFLEMGEYSKAEQYFNTALSSLNPKDEEIACIYYNFGRAHCSKRDFGRAINCYNRAYNLHMKAVPKRLASAGKTLNGLGIVYNKQGRVLKAEECFQAAMSLYKKSIPKNHVDVAETLMNLGTIDCIRKNFKQALNKYEQAKKILATINARKLFNQTLPVQDSAMKLSNNFVFF